MVQLWVPVLPDAQESHTVLGKGMVIYGMSLVTSALPQTNLSFVTSLVFVQVLDHITSPLFYLILTYAPKKLSAFSLISQSGPLYINSMQ